MRRTILLAAAAALYACSQPPQQQAEAPAAPQAPIVRACNALEPDMSRAVLLTEEAVAVASLPPELPGGPITPGIYDLVSGVRTAEAPAWTDAQAISIELAEGTGGVTINWAQAGSSGEAQRWTATFHQGPPARLAFTCGREGQAEISFSAQSQALELHLPAEGAGAHRLSFARRV